jgi:dTMP kinase
MIDQEQAVSVPPEVRETIETRVAWARALVIRTAEEREQAVGIVREVKGLIAKIKADCEDSVSTTHKAWKAALAFQKKFLEGPETIEAMCKSAVRKWDDEQEELRRKEQARLQAIEDERRRKEQAALEAAARVQREKEEAARRAEEEARKRAQEAANEVDRARALAKAEIARKAAEAAAAKAEEKASAAMDLPPPVAVSVAGPAKQAGESTAVIHKARVVDAIAFIRAAVGHERFEFVDVNEKALNDFAKRTKGAVPLTGVEFYTEKQLRVGGR